MTQAVWRSPLLPLQKQSRSSSAQAQSDIGTGGRFKRDLLTYLKAYGPRKTGGLVQQLTRYDFDQIRAALVASVPSKQHLAGLDSDVGTLWGWPALKDLMGRIPTQRPKDDSGGQAHIVAQQLQYMRPHLCRWAGDDSNYVDLSEDTPTKYEAGRGRAAPHIKTYIRFADRNKMDSIDWALVTSANLSTQAWGAATNPSGEVRISSWEIGVAVWPDLFSDASARGHERGAPGSANALMVPCFKKDQPDSIPNHLDSQGQTTVVGFRMPYDLPLTPYRASDEPWCATATHHLPDWQGQSWIS
ncbi:hypothetical protein N7492_005290 [Penicillium capsulatum]|uniref:Tyrosyl-DNA phosphodiesterase n=1 Tax=Penicillium capsulatum TaxID=69766 RepID=A0A9W9IFH5_9EURO|nr:hypothetical protein N7492_005290 [Penicillium capsulatum]